jgi:hypothetical protein
MEEMGDWSKVLEVVDSELSEAASPDDEASYDITRQPDDALLFVSNDDWNGSQYLRCRHSTLLKAPCG